MRQLTCLEQALEVRIRHAIDPNDADFPALGPKEFFQETHNLSKDVSDQQVMVSCHPPFHYDTIFTILSSKIAQIGQALLDHFFLFRGVDAPADHFALHVGWDGHAQAIQDRRSQVHQLQTR